MSQINRIVWHEKYEIGVQRIDFEHRIFTDLINNLADKIEGHKDMLSLTRSLREIVKYADFHFISEENIMTEIGYPGLKEHTALHRQLQQTLNERSLALAAGEESPADLLNFLVAWFLDHTVREDSRISLYC